MLISLILLIIKYITINILDDFYRLKYRTESKTGLFVSSFNIFNQSYP